MQGGDRDCGDFTSQPEAQGYFLAIGGSVARNADRLDRNRNGVACEDYPYPTARRSVPASPRDTVPIAVPAQVFSQVRAVPQGGVDTGDGSTGS